MNVRKWDNRIYTDNTERTCWFRIVFLTILTPQTLIGAEYTSTSLKPVALVFHGG